MVFHIVNGLFIIIRFIVLVACLVPSASAADISGYITSWDDVKQLLKERNIDYLAVDFLKLDHHCRSQFYISNSAELNQCRYKSAIHYYTYNLDKPRCINESRREFPDDYVNKKVITNSNFIKAEDPQHYARQAFWLSEQYSDKHLHRDRDKFFRRCMRMAGWNNPDTWQEGKIDGFSND